MEAGSLQSATGIFALRLPTDDLASPTNGLLNLSNELLFRVTDYLDSTSLLSLRAASKHLGSVAHKRFTDTFIAETVVSASRPGLERLVSLSTCKDFDCFIKKIVVKHHGKQKPTRSQDILLKRSFEALRKSKNQVLFGVRQVDTYGVSPIRSCQRIAEFAQNMLDVAVRVGLDVRGISIDLEYAFSDEKPQFDANSDVLEMQRLKSALFASVNDHCAFSLSFFPRSDSYPLDSHVTFLNGGSNFGMRLQASQVHIKNSPTLPNKTLTAIQLAGCDIDASALEKLIRDNRGSLRYLCLAQVRSFFHPWNSTPLIGSFSGRD